MMAVGTGVRCVDFVKNKLDFSVEKVFILTDSLCVLKWIV